MNAIIDIVVRWLTKSMGWLAIPLERKRKMIKWFKRIICKYKGHRWETYIVSTGYWSYDIEQAGYCTRCGYDTHGEYHK